MWTSDLLPDPLADPTAQMMDRGLAAIQATLGGDRRDQEVSVSR